MALFSEAGLAVAGAMIMSNREKINYLKRYVWLDKRIDKKLEMLSEWRSRLGKIGPVISNIPGGGGSIYKSKDLDLIDKIVDIEAQLDKEIDELVDLKEEIEAAINGLKDEKEKTLMEYRYLSGMTFEWIASEMHYHWRSVHKIHVTALSKLQIGQ